MIILFNLMGIVGLYKNIKQNFQFQDRIQYKKHNIIDFSNIIFHKFLQQRNKKLFTPQIKINQLLQFCQTLIDKDKFYYIIMDPMGDKKRCLQFDFSEYNELIKPNELNYNNEQKLFYILNENDEVIKTLNLKQIKRKNKPAKFNETQMNSDILKIPIYNNIIVQQFFRNFPNVKIINAQFEADVSIGVLVKKLLSEGINKGDITIISRDSDMITYANGVYVQSDRQIIKQDWISGLQYPEYLFICGSSYYPTVIQVDQFMKSQNQKELYEQLKENALKNLDIQFIISDIIYTHYDKIMDNIQENSCMFGIKNLREAILYNIVFSQCILKIENIYTGEQLEKIFGFDLVKQAFNNKEFTQFFREDENKLLDYYKQNYPKFFINESV